MNNSEKLRLNEVAIRLNVSRSEWEPALEQAEPDVTVGIRHAVLSGNEDWRIHVAAIPQKVGCHYHQYGDETYEVVQGKGTLHFGKVVLSGNLPEVAWEIPLGVASGDCFVVPEGYAHQLQRRGTENLTILFACPDSHIDDKGDRHHLLDSPHLSVAAL
ncbi:MAG: hypothetical protein HC886_11155 [Leptolyngbyaceae cyanobacterium SM1_1_3]|nr:hypothetical protein [Leptolyngbyaceae cyanobacterium SM1_1_3]NJN02568.1 hypothetical protein [Leptolyngbyaceae cyanobacterium RM1_1_2]NJO08584.1 hypothetical protein [Leptolyngbyaceae cyanobacterium SL_1_1]